MKLRKNRYHFVFDLRAQEAEMRNSMIFGAKGNNVRSPILTVLR
jgi:hypothetical protein